MNCKTESMILPNYRKSVICKLSTAFTHHSLFFTILFFFNVNFFNFQQESVETKNKLKIWNTCVYLFLYYML